MAEQFSMNAAAGFAWRRRERRGVLLGASAAYVIVLVLIFLTWGYLNREGIGAYMQMVMQASEGAAPDPANMPPQVLALAGSYLLLLPVIGVLYAALEAAVLRWLIRGVSGGGVLGLDLGPDTWRVFLCYLCWVGVFIVGYLGLAVAALVGGALGGLIKAPVLALVTITAALCAWAYCGVRLAPAAAVTVGREEFSFFRAWDATRGRFWSLFGAFAVLFILYLVALIVTELVAGGLLMAPLGAAMRNEDFGALTKAAAEPGMLARIGVFYVIVLGAAQVFVVAFMGVNAFAAIVAHEEGKV